MRPPWLPTGRHVANGHTVTRRVLVLDGGDLLLVGMLAGELGAAQVVGRGGGVGHGMSFLVAHDTENDTHSEKLLVDPTTGVTTPLTATVTWPNAPFDVVAIGTD